MLRLFKDTYAPLLRQSHQVMSPDWRLAEPGESAEAYAWRAIGQMEDFLAECADTTAAVIVEPLVQGAAGMAMYHPIYLRPLRELCDRYRVHLIADEIAVGFGRTGTLFACEQAGIRPDFLCLSKGITGGYLPLSCVLTPTKSTQAFYDDSTARGFLHSHSYTGNRSPAAPRWRCWTSSSRTRCSMRNRPKPRASTNARPHRRASARPPFPQHRHDLGIRCDGAAGLQHPTFHQHALARGLFIRPIGNTVYFMPPYVIEEAEMRLMASENRP
jgi:adenosylmethionine-8-amino-7-oxononanoate aminotransferase